MSPPITTCHCLSVTVCSSPSVTVWHPVCVCVALCHCHGVSLSAIACHCLSLSVVVCLSLSVGTCHHLAFSGYHCLSVVLCLCSDEQAYLSIHCCIDDPVWLWRNTHHPYHNHHHDPSVRSYFDFKIPLGLGHVPSLKVFGYGSQIRQCKSFQPACTTWFQRCRRVLGIWSFRPACSTQFWSCKKG